MIIAAAVTLLLLFLVFVLGSRLFPDPMPEGVVLEEPPWYVRVALSVLVPLSCLLVACCLGAFWPRWARCNPPGAERSG